MESINEYIISYENEAIVYSQHIKSLEGAFIDALFLITNNRFWLRITRNGDIFLNGKLKIYDPSLDSVVKECMVLMAREESCNRDAELELREDRYEED